MANFDDFKKKAMDAFETIADVSVEAYKAAEEKAKVIAKSTKLSADISRERSMVRRLYIETGRTYYELHKDNPGEAFEQNCDAIAAAITRIAAKRQELEDLKKNNADFEDAGFDPAPENDVDSDEQANHSDKSPDDE